MNFLSRIADFYLNFLVKRLKFPELVVCKLNKSKEVVYLTKLPCSDSCEGVWDKSLNNALLFQNIQTIKRKFVKFDSTKHLVISFLDKWTDQQIKNELGYGS